MLERQPDLFDGLPAPRIVAGAQGLIIGKRPEAPLSRAQKTFNRLVRRIEKLRGSIEEEQRRLDAQLKCYVDQLRPLEQEIIGLRKTSARLLFPFLSDRRIKGRRDRQVLRQVIEGHFLALLGSGGVLAEEDLRKIFEKIDGRSVAEAERESLDALKSELGDLFGDLGIDIDLSEVRSDMTEEEFARQAAEWREKLAGAEPPPADPPPGGRPKSRRTLEREARARAAEALRNRDLARLYKQLAKLLHPDLEQDPDRRREKEAAMKVLTTAYKGNDLHALLRLELEWIRREQANAAGLTDEKLAIYNEVLKEQVFELEDDLRSLSLHPRFEPLRHYSGPLGLRIHFDERMVRQQLQDLAEELRSSHRALQSVNPLPEVRRLLHRHLRNRSTEFIVDWD